MPTRDRLQLACDAHGAYVSGERCVGEDVRFERQEDRLGLWRGATIARTWMTTSS
jgi:hypothetical protein